ncbi:MAG: threonine/serine exporter family protein, partial [Bacteroidota bacterium]
MEQAKNAESKELGSLLLDVGVALLSAGASCSRIRITMRRFAGIYDYTAHISIQPKSVSLTLNDDEENACFNGMRSIPAQGVNFKTISGISRLSWRALEDNLSISEVKTIFDQLLLLPHYPRIIILV